MGKDNDEKAMSKIPDRRYSLLVIDDDESILEVLRDYCLELDCLDFTGTTSPMEAIDLFGSSHFDIVLSDYRMPVINGIELVRKLKTVSPDTFFLIMTAYAELETAIDAVRAGLFDFIIKPFGKNDFERAVTRVKETLDLKHQNTFLRSILQEKGGKGGLFGNSEKLSVVREKLRIFAPSDASILITGETGVGKEISARMVHSESGRRNEPFVAVNCSAYAETLLESELFGHEKGAFTGAGAKRIGRFEFAGDGSIFLDEISEIPAPLQVKLLRVLQEKEFERVGGNETIPLRARVISATNCDLLTEIKAGRFREDLYYRINTLNVHIPPLRERREDIMELAEHFIARFSTVYEKEAISLDGEARSAILNCRWPGNVRQLENALEYATLCSINGIITMGSLPGEVFINNRTESSPAVTADDEAEAESENLVTRIERMEIDKIKTALSQNQWNRSQTARELGLTRKQLVDRIKKYAIT